MILVGRLRYIFMPRYKSIPRYIRLLKDKIRMNLYSSPISHSNTYTQKSTLNTDTLRHTDTPRTLGKIVAEKVFIKWKMFLIENHISIE